ncbi:MAG: hypothetical protein AAF357_17700, partial [Verrucomicrobiota bacterium]
MKRVLLMACHVGLSGLGLVSAQDESIVDQRNFVDSNNGCGPASVLNCLKFSRPELRGIYDDILGSTDGVKMRLVVDRYFRHRDSVVYPEQKRWGIHGVATADLAAGMNEL